MTSVEYELIRKKRPDLRLQPWDRLHRADQRKAKRLWPDELIARRTAVLFRREPGKVDRRRLKQVPKPTDWAKGYPVHGIAKGDVVF
jgi:hypothetical protein